MPSITATASGTVTVSGTVSGSYVTLSGQASLPVSVQTFGGGVVTKNVVAFDSLGPTFNDLKYAKAVTASTGAINSADGLIQSIS